MAEVEIKAGARFNLASPDDVRHQTGVALSQFYGDNLKAVSGIWMPVLNKLGTSPFTMGGDTGLLVQGPLSGYAWSVRRIVVTGMTRTSTPDIIQITRGQGGAVLWEVNGNSYAVTFGRGEMVLRAGESLFYQSVGTFAATGNITAQGFAQQVPEEREGEFYV